MPESNPLFLEVYEEPPLQGVGWEVVVRDPSDFSDIIAINPEFISLQFTVEMSGEGIGSINIDYDYDLFQRPHSFPQTMSIRLLNEENLWEFYEDGQLRFQWFASKVSDVQADKSEERPITISGPGIAHCLSWAVVMPPGFPTSTAPFWTFKDVSVMNAYWQLLRAAQQRGTIGFVLPKFTSTRDSIGLLWADDPSFSSTVFVEELAFGFKPDLGTNLLDLLNQVTGQEATEPWPINYDWIMRPNFSLEVRKEIGVHRENEVVFSRGHSIVKKQRNRQRDDISNYIVVRDIYGRTTLRTNPTSISYYRQREALFNKSQVLSNSLRAQIADTYLRLTSNQMTTFDLAIDPTAERRRPFREFNVGDYIGVDNELGQIEINRVMAISCKISSDGEFDCELSLGSRDQLNERKAKRRLTQLENRRATGSLLDTPGVRINPTTTEDGATLSYRTTGDNAGQWVAARHVWIQNDEPTEATPGDFWLQA